MPESPDIANQLAGVAAGSRLSELRQQRPDVARYIQGSYTALFEPSDLAGLSRAERELAALRAATLIGSAPLIRHHQARLRELGGEAQLLAAEQGADAPGLAPRAAAIVRHTDLLTRAPGAASQAAIAELRSNGLAARDIVTLAQLVAFVNFQARVLAGLRLLGEGA